MVVDSTKNKVQSLTKEQLLNLAKKLNNKKDLKRENKIERRSNNLEKLSLSLSQQRMWFLNQVDSENAFYNAPVVLEFSGKLNVDILKETLNKIVERHEIIRTEYFEDDGESYQRIKNIKLEVPYIDMSLEDDKDKMAQDYIDKYIRLPFDLGKAPLMRASILKLDDEKNILVVVMHHIIFDGWSLGLFFKELNVIYDSLKNGRPIPLKELKVQYSDYALWEKERYLSGALDKQIDFWKKKLQGKTAPIQLPIDKVRPEVETYKGAKYRRIISDELNEAINKFAVDNGVTPFMVFLAATNIMLYRYSNERSINVGTAVANRTHTEIEDLIGLFMNTVIINNEIDPKFTFKEFLLKCKESSLESFENQDVTFEKIVEYLHPERCLGYNPLFQVGFFVQNAPLSKIDLEDVTAKIIPTDMGTSKFDLSFQFMKLPYGMELEVEYSTELFFEDTIKRITDSLLMILEESIQNPSQKISEINILSSEEISMLDSLNETDKEFDTPKLLHEFFIEQAKKTPDNIAIIFEDKELTYRELDEKSNQVANYLVKQGVKPDSLVALFFERSFEMYIAILGVIKAGAAYVPMDVKYPISRIEYIVEDTKAPIILTQEKNIGLLKELSDIAIPIDSGWDLFNGESKEYVPSEVKENNLAYIIYTSGSTGKPKGAMNEHKGISSRLSWGIGYFNFNESDRVIQKTTYTFDVSIPEMFCPLCVGATLVISKSGFEGVSDYLIDVIKEYKVTVANFVPSMLGIILEDERISECTSLKAVICTGEEVPVRLKNNFYKKLKDSKLYNLYGPTEAAVQVTYCLCEPEDEKVTIGKPMNNVQTYILDENMNRVPIGVIGELYIGGDFVGRGYLNRKDLTDKSFVTDIFRKNGEKIYKTGDLAKYLPDGNIDFLGRRDFQVKLRGLRIETTEIEGALNRNDVIENSIVLAEKDSMNTLRLVAYVVIKDNAELNVRELKQFLSTLLPEYMIPTMYIKIKEIPHLNNGKVDRKSLPSVSEVYIDNSEKLYAKTDTEKALVSIWSKLLWVDNIGIEDSFFELGGHSLLAIQLATEINKNFKVKIPLKEIITNPTIRFLSDYIDNYEEKNNLSDEMNIAEIKPNQEERYESFPLNKVQEAYWVGRANEIELGSVGSHGYFEIDIDADVENIKKAIHRVIERHDMLRAVIEDDGTQRILRNVPEYKIEVNNFVNETYKEQGILKVREELSHKVYKTNEYPMFDFVLSKLADNKVRMHFSIDMLIADAQSIYIIIDELGRFISNPYLELEPLELSFRDYVLSESEIKKTNKYKNAKNYWLNKIKDLPPAPKLPLINSTKDIKTPIFKRVQGTLSKEKWEELKRKAGRFSITPSIIFLSVYFEVLSLWSKEKKFTVDLTLFNRLPLHKDVEKIIGDFTSVTFLDMDMEDKDSFVVIAKELQEKLWDNLDNREFNGIDILREIVKETKDSSRALMPVVFTSTLTQSKLGLDVSVVDSLGEFVYGISQTPQVYIDNQVYEEKGVLKFHWDYLESIFPEKLIDYMFEIYCLRIQQLIDSDEAWENSCNINRLETSSNKLLKEINDTENKFDICRLEEKVGNKNDDAIAVLSEDKNLTYKELNSLSNNVAKWIKDISNKEQEKIAIVMEKGYEQIVAALGVLKSNNIYVPIDINMPVARKQIIFEESNINIILTQSKYKESSQLPYAANILYVDEVECDNSNYNLDSHYDIDELAYIIYTSGSTGKPKGVAIEHGAAMNTVLDINSKFKVNESDRILALSSLSFDLSVYDIFGMLNAGGAIVVPKNKDNIDPSYWLMLLKQYDVSIWNTVPTTMDLLVDYMESCDEKLPDSLRVVMLSGDWIPLNLPDRIKKLSNKDIKVISLGGATEASIWSIMYEIGEIKDKWTSIPYGMPLANQEFYILDDKMHKKPIWATGELYIAGKGLAKEYIGNKEKTESSFIWNEELQKRLYKTGDLGRYLPDGNIEFIGRADYQVKIRGFRIELGEIKNVLNDNESVNDSVVTIKEDKDGQKNIVAYVKLKTKCKISEEDIIKYLSSKLPAYMIPSYVMIIDSWPLNVNGKIDIASLPMVSEKVKESTTNNINSKKVSDKLIDLVKKAINMENIDLNTDLIGLGITSVDIVKMINSIRKNLGIKIRFDEFYKNPTIANILELYVDNSESSSDDFDELISNNNVLDIVKEVLDIQDITEDTDLLGLGITSVDIVKMINSIRKKLGIKVRFDEFYKNPTVRTIINLNNKNGKKSKDIIVDLDERDRFKERKLYLRKDLKTLSIPLLDVCNKNKLNPDVLNLQACREFSKEKIKLETISVLLDSVRSRVCNNKEARLYPSFGELYAVQTYVYIAKDRVEGIESGIYYYNPKENKLYLVSKEEIPEDIYVPFVYRPVFKKAAFSIFLIANLDAIEPLYGENSLRLVTIEAGYIGQLLDMVSANIGLGVHPVGIIDFEKIENKFKLNGNYKMVHSLLGGLHNEEMQQNIGYYEDYSEDYSEDWEEGEI
ncbi:MAG: amino acid adenylation domain-containing protein [Clostridium sp.]|nr:amino acid adenylation domain-containing protein [Clostridium sp.]